MKRRNNLNISNCPFCNKPAFLKVDDKENGDTTRRHTIYCSDVFGCGARMDDYISFWERDYDQALKDFVKRWNTRV